MIVTPIGLTRFYSGLFVSNSCNLGSTRSSAWTRSPASPRIFHRGGNFYNFQGLRDYKSKFSPRWEPRYIAVPSTWSLPTALIGGGLRGALAKKNA